MVIAKRLSIVTTTRNSIDVVEAYLAGVGALDRRLFDWIIVDAASTDGTREYLQEHANRFDWFISEPDPGIYFGLNKAIARVRTEYYVVLGADDRPSPSLINDVLPFLDDANALLLGAVRLVPSGRIKRPGRRSLRTWSWGKVISHHSVGTIIQTKLHERFGAYDTAYRVVADGAFLMRVLMSDEPVVFTDTVFGEYFEGGISAQQHLRSLCESFIVQVQGGSSLTFQLLLLNARLAKMMLVRVARSTWFNIVS